MSIVATQSGLVNSVRLTSPMRVLGSIEFHSSDSLMPPVVVPLPRDLTVRVGDVVKLEFQYECESDWSQFGCSAELDASLDEAYVGTPHMVPLQPRAATLPRPTGVGD